jgi:hypothetical protein
MDVSPVYEDSTPAGNQPGYLLHAVIYNTAFIPDVDFQSLAGNRAYTYKLAAVQAHRIDDLTLSQSPVVV